MSRIVPPPKVHLLGIGVSATTYDQTATLVLDRAVKRQPLIVSALAVHGLMCGVLDKELGRKLNDFDVLTPDGQPVRWAVNAFGRHGLEDRVYGPTLMLRICALAQARRVGIYLFGSTETVLAALAEALRRRFPELEIAGCQADRFREATAKEDAGDIRRIRDSGAGVVFCGRGCPRQERWCHVHRDALSIPLIAVGAAFDFHAGTLRQAPAVLQRAGLEWLFRLAHEPRRLWRRYLLLNPLFVGGILLQAMGLWRSGPVGRKK